MPVLLNMLNSPDFHYDLLNRVKAAVLLLAIDVSARAMGTGQLDHICRQICSQLQALNG